MAIKLTLSPRDLLWIQETVKVACKYSELSKQLNVNIKTENQYRLALLGASKEIVERDDIYWVYYNIDRQHFFGRRDKPY